MHCRFEYFFLLGPLDQLLISNRRTARLGKYVSRDERTTYDAKVVWKACSAYRQLLERCKGRNVLDIGGNRGNVGERAAMPRQAEYSCLSAILLFCILMVVQNK